jgi:hypothetical protein
MENYQKIEKIGEGEHLALVSLRPWPAAIHALLINWRVFADSYDQVHMVLSTKLATLRMLVELSHSKRSDWKLKMKECPARPSARSPFSKK